MSYSVKTIPKFEKNLKKLAKKYPSLKAEYIRLVQTLKENLNKVQLSAKTVIKYVLPLLQKEKEKVVEQE